MTNNLLANYLILSAKFPPDEDGDLWPFTSITTDVGLPQAPGPIPDEILEALPHTTFHLDEDADLLPMLCQPFLPPPGLLVSPEFAEFLQQYSLPPECSFHETTVHHCGLDYVAYWMNISGFNTGLIDFERTKFARFRPAYKEAQSSSFVPISPDYLLTMEENEVPVHNEQELFQILGEMSGSAPQPADGEQTLPEAGNTQAEQLPEDTLMWDSLSEAERDKALEKLALSANPGSSDNPVPPPGEASLDVVAHDLYLTSAVDYDILIFPFPSPVLFVSERLAPAIEEFGAESGWSDYTFLPVTYNVYA